MHCQQVCAVGSASVNAARGVMFQQPRPTVRPVAAPAKHRIYAYTSIRQSCNEWTAIYRQFDTWAKMPAYMRFAAYQPNCLLRIVIQHFVLMHTVQLHQQRDRMTCRMLNHPLPTPLFPAPKSKKIFLLANPNRCLACTICADLRNCLGEVGLPDQPSARDNASPKRVRSASVFVSVAQTSSAFSYSG